MEIGLQNLKDSELLDAFKRTAESIYFQEIYRRYREKIRNGCLKFFRGNDALAEDATQDAFVKALEKIRQCAIDSIGGWLYTVAKHSCIDIYRRQMISLNSSSSNLDRIPKINGSELRAQEKESKLLKLRQLLNELDEKQRICLKLYLEGYSYKEISKLTQLNEKAVKSAIQTGKENIKKRI
ncbi:RNA polymerase sigma factor [bacterium]|nr:RNA polymerase sigma factor [bacterium]